METEKTNKKNTKTIVFWTVAAVLLLGTVAAFIWAGDIYGENSVFNKEISSNGVVNTLYQKIPALIKSVQIIVIGGLISFILRAILSRLFTKSAQATTIIKLVNNFIKYIAVIVMLFLVLGAWGVDTTTLLASAGILALIIGLGAESLIADVIAGLFIVFEGNFRIGDIVVIDGWRGTVDEIGIRTTRIVDAGGNVKIINNNNISDLVNNTRRESLAKVTVGIEYGESLERVEAVIAENLGSIKESIPAITEGPFYKGVAELGSSSVDLMFVAKCGEEDIYQVQRDLNREIKLLFDANDINIPFTQITLNQPPEFKHKTTNKEKKTAEEFVEEQKELSKGIEKDNG